MAEKFSIFANTFNKADPLQSSINFKKSPNKFAVYEPNHRVKEFPKYNPYQSASTTNLQQLKRLPHEYSNLRQTLNFKALDFDGFIHEQEEDQNQKSSNILRQTFNTKGNYKPRSEKAFSESFAGHEIQSAHQFYDRNQTVGGFGYNKGSSSHMTQSKSMHTLPNPRTVEKKYYGSRKFEEKVSDWK